MLAILAADYPFLDVLWTLVIFFLWVMWFWLLISVIGDVFRRRDIGGGKKTLWLIFMLFVPFIGILAYLIVNSDGMAERNIEQRPPSRLRSTPMCGRPQGAVVRRRGDRQGQAAARLRRDYAGGIRRDQGQGARVAAPERRKHMSELGPVDYMIVAFPGNEFRGEIAPALADLVEKGTIRIIDLAFVGRTRTATSPRSS